MNQLSLDFDKTPKQATLEELVRALSKESKCRKAESILRKELMTETLKTELEKCRTL